MSAGVMFFVVGVVAGLAGSIINSLVDHLLGRGRKKVEWRREQEMLDKAGVRSAITEDIRSFETEERITTWFQKSLVPDEPFYFLYSHPVLILVAGLTFVAITVWSLVRNYPKSMAVPGFVVGWIIVAFSRPVVRRIRRPN